MLIYHAEATMYPVHDVDAILLLSLSVAAKRRPANLESIIAATDLAHDAIPNPVRLSDSFNRLSSYGLILEIDGCYTLSSDAQSMMTNQRKKDDSLKKLSRLKEHLADYYLKGEHITVDVFSKDIQDAISAYRAEKKITLRSWLIEKPKPIWISKKDLVRGASLPAKRRKI
jgi:hypothetical protein